MATIIQVPGPADFHVHLRQGNLCELVTPHVRQGGFSLAYVMPNLAPPIKNTDQALAYKAILDRIEPGVQYLMTLYLSPELTPQEIQTAKQAGIVGVKSYPRGVTTNSDTGIESYTAYYHVFEEMQTQDMVLNLHGEVPSDANTNTCVLNAERHFLKHLEQLHKDFPRLRIVLEHATTKEAVETVKRLGSTVACTITAHHLALTVDDWAGQSFNFCKPVAKYPEDREALRAVIKEGHPRFFLGSDSAPHTVSKKATATPDQPCAAGVYTAPILLPLVAHLLESFGALDHLVGFTSANGRAFYKVETTNLRPVTLRKEPFKIAESLSLNEDDIAPFWAGKQLNCKRNRKIQIMSSVDQQMLVKPAFFVCDIQERFRPAIYEFTCLVATSRRLLEVARLFKAPVFVTEQNPKALGTTVAELDLAALGELHAGTFAKTKFSMFIPEVHAKLNEHGIQTVILFGIESHVCVLQTTFDLLRNGYNVHIVADAVSSCNKEEIPIALARLRQAGAVVTTSESLAFQLMGDASYDGFKQFSGLVKAEKQAISSSLRGLLANGEAAPKSAL